MPVITLRDAAPSDAASLLAIYRPFVLETAVSFEIEPPSLDECRVRIQKALEGWAWLVAEVDGEVSGYAYGSLHRPREAYRWSVETSAYVRAGHRGKGLGRRLYAALMPRLAERGYCNAYAGIALPNEASIAFHKAMGFQPVGVFKSAGWKFGRWYDVSWWHLPIRDTPPLD